MAIFWIVTRLSLYVSDYQVMGEGSKGDQTGLIPGLSEGVLEDGGSKESLPVDESEKRGSLSFARAGR